jgi:ribosome recycling factor
MNKTPFDIIKEFYSKDASFQAKTIKHVKAQLKKLGYARPNPDLIDRTIVELYTTWSKNKLVNS